MKGGDKMDTLAARSFRALLAVTLAANCFMPCYTLAYADDAGASDDSGVAPSDGQGSPVVYDVEPSPDFPLVESGDGGADDSYGGFGEDADGNSFYSDNDSGSFDSDTSGDSPTVNYDDQVTSYAANALDTMLNAALSQLGAEFGSSLWNNITGYTDTSITRINMVMNADTRLILYKRLPNIERSIDYLETVADDIANRLYSLQQKNDTLISVLRQQWGYNYGTGNTVVVHSNSPAGWLQSAAARLNYNGSLVGGDSDDYSAARLLARVHNALYGSITYAETGNTGVRSAVGVLGYIANLDYYNGLKLNEIRSLEKYQGSLNGSTVDDVYGTARLLARLFNMNYQEITYAETGSTAYRSTAGILGYIANLTYYNGLKLNEIRSLDKYQGFLNGEDVDSVYGTARLLARLFNMNFQEVTYAETGTTAYRSTAGILGYIANLTYYNGQKSDGLRSALVSHSSMVSKGFSDVLAALGSLSVGVEVDFSGIESRLDSVVRLLTAAGVVENSKDLFGAILGDLSLPSTASAIGSIKDALSTAFPFCLPSVVNLVLFGSVVAAPQAPVWEFDIAGNPLVVDFAPYEDFAEVCRWTVRLLFVAALLLNTRKFVYGMGGVS